MFLAIVLLCCAVGFWGLSMYHLGRADELRNAILGTLCAALTSLFAVSALWSLLCSQ